MTEATLGTQSAAVWLVVTRVSEKGKQLQDPDLWLDQGLVLEAQVI